MICVVVVPPACPSLAPRHHHHDDDDDLFDIFLSSLAYDKDNRQSTIAIGRLCLPSTSTSVSIVELSVRADAPIKSPCSLCDTAKIAKSPGVIAIAIAISSPPQIF